MDYREAREYLDRMSVTGTILGLDSIRMLMAWLGNPEDSLKIIHIAGTNGKGSILKFTQQILTEAGYKVGTYSSPSVLGYLDKFQVGGEWMTEDELPPLVSEVKAAADRMVASGHAAPTVFELETAIAFLYFKARMCDYVVLEVGMGGDLDSTNVIKNPLVCAFATISLDHIGILGSTVQEIAKTKSGIIKPSATVVTGCQRDEALEVLKAEAARCGCEIREVDTDSIACISHGEISYRPIEHESVYAESDDFAQNKQDRLDFSDPSGALHQPGYLQRFSYLGKEHTIRMLGKHQVLNACTAIEIIEALRRRRITGGDLLARCDIEISDEALERGLEKAFWPGRFEVLRGRDAGGAPGITWILDGAHNEDAARRLAESLEQAKFDAVIGVFKDKDYETIARLLAPHLATVYTVDLPNSARSLDKETLAQVFAAEGVQAVPADSIEAAIDMAASDVGATSRLGNGMAGKNTIITGSLSYLGRAREYIIDRYIE